MGLQFTTLVTKTVPLLARATASYATSTLAPTQTSHPTAVPNHAAPQKPSLFKRIILPIIIVLILIIIIAVAIIVFMKWRKRQQQTSTETKETYPPSEEQYNPNSNPVTPHEVQNGENHEMQNQTRPQGEAAEYYDNTAGHQAQTWQPVPGVNVTQGAYGQEGQQPQQQPQQQSQQQPQEDNKKKAMELAKKGWQMYKEHKNKPAA